MTQAIIAHGLITERSRTGATDSFTAIPEAKGVAIPGITQDYVEATHNQSPGGFREWIKGLKDGGELAIPCNYTSAGYAAQIQDRDHNEPTFYRVTFPLAPGQTEPDRFAFRAWPNPSIEESEDPGAIIAMSVNLRVTGPVDFIQGTPVNAPVSAGAGV